MTHIFNIPSELLCLVLEHTDVSGIKSLASSCKEMHDNLGISSKNYVQLLLSIHKNPTVALNKSVILGMNSAIIAELIKKGACIHRILSYKRLDNNQIYKDNAITIAIKNGHVNALIELRKHGAEFKYVLYQELYKYFSQNGMKRKHLHVLKYLYDNSENIGEINTKELNFDTKAFCFWLLCSNKSTTTNGITSYMNTFNANPLDFNGTAITVAFAYGTIDVINGLLSYIKDKSLTNSNYSQMMQRWWRVMFHFKNTKALQGFLNNLENYEELNVVIPLNNLLIQGLNMNYYDISLIILRYYKEVIDQNGIENIMYNCMFQCITNNRINTFQAFLKTNIVDITKFNHLAFRLTLQTVNFNFMPLIVDHYKGINPEFRLPDDILNILHQFLLISIEHGRIDILRTCKNISNMDFNRHQEHLLTVAIYFNNVDIVLFLINECNLNKTIVNGNAIYLATVQNNTEVVKVLLEFYYDYVMKHNLLLNVDIMENISYQLRTSFLHAVSSTHKNIVDTMINSYVIFCQTEHEMTNGTSKQLSRIIVMHILEAQWICTSQNKFDMLQNICINENYQKMVALLNSTN